MNKELGIATRGPLCNGCQKAVICEETQASLQPRLKRYEVDIESLVHARWSIADGSPPDCANVRTRTRLSKHTANLS